MAPDSSLDAAPTVDPAAVDFRRVARVARAANLQEIILVKHSAVLQVPREQFPEGELEILSHPGGSFTFDRTANLLHVTSTLRVELRVKSNGSPLATFETSYRLAYGMAPGAIPETDQLEDFTQFSAVNGIFHAWPYFREIVQSSSGRMGLAPIVLPLLRINEVSVQESSDSK